jgi:lauroyl/myristoyl acyltransferase
VVLLGWHQGPVKLLHGIPADGALRAERREAGSGSKNGNTPFAQFQAPDLFVMTASAFSPELADWMARGRNASGVTVIRPDDTPALRTWVKSNGVLAVMTDQVPGAPEDWLSLQNGVVSIPWPRRLMDWIATRDPECLAVSVRLEPGDRIVFRYERINAASMKDGLAVLMEDALNRAPEQYNWSYPKIAVSCQPSVLSPSRKVRSLS